MGRPIIRIAVDPGYSSIKVVIEGIIITIPSEVIENTGNEDKFLAEKKDGFASITDFGKNYLVGNYARKLLLEENRQAAQDVNQSVLEDFDRFGTQYFEVSMKAAIGIALIRYCEFSQKKNLNPKVRVEDLSECNIYLSIAVPHAVYELKNKGPIGLMRNRLYTNHEYKLELAEKTYNLKYTIRNDCAYTFQSQVIAALLGTLADEYDEEMDIIQQGDSDKPILVIDGGYRTVGIFKLSQIDTVEEAESNKDFAMALVDEKVAEIMHERGRNDIKCYNIQEYYDNNEEITVLDDGETHTITINKDREEISAEFCGMLIDYLREKYNNLLPIKQILITGGTGAAYYGTFVHYINTHPDTAHLKGKVKLAAYKFYGQQAEPMHTIVCGLYKQFKRYLDQTLAVEEAPEPRPSRSQQVADSRRASNGRREG